MLRWVDELPLAPLLVAAVLLGMSPFLPEPHLLRDVRLLVAGRLRTPADVFDLCLHASLPLLLMFKLLRGRRLADRRRQ